MIEREAKRIIAVYVGDREAEEYILMWKTFCHGISLDTFVSELCKDFESDNQRNFFARQMTFIQKYAEIMMNKYLRKKDQPSIDVIRSTNAVLLLASCLERKVSEFEEMYAYVKKGIACLRSGIHEKDETIKKLQQRIDELEKSSIKK